MHHTARRGRNIAIAVIVATGSALLAVPTTAHGESATSDIHQENAGSFTTAQDLTIAATYDPALVPVGATFKVKYEEKSKHQDVSTKVKVEVNGLTADRAFGAHLHAKPCGATGDDAGPHFQYITDPVQPSVDPAYANPRNEVWLDFTTGKKGEAKPETTVSWRADLQRRPMSLIIHDHHTHTGPGHAGTAGPRLACVNLPWTTGGTFGGPGSSARGVITYDTSLVPVGARATVSLARSESPKEKRTQTRLEVSGLVPGRVYGAHAHVGACGPTGADAGGHFQNVQDPTQPSMDPAYANSKNEIWLDFSTDRAGSGHAESKVSWLFGARQPHSIVIHEHRTSTSPGSAGMAGARVACVDLPNK